MTANSESDEPIAAADEAAAAEEAEAIAPRPTEGIAADIIIMIDG